jgi:hypothetical protein
MQQLKGLRLQRWQESTHPTPDSPALGLLAGVGWESDQFWQGVDSCQR